MTLDMVRDRVATPESNRQQELFKTIRNITLSDGYTKPYQFATLKLVTVEPKDLPNYGAIALYAVKDRLDKSTDLDSKCQDEFGKSLNEIDGLYQFDNGKVIAPPLVETFNGFGKKINPENSNIVDGLHRFIDCIAENKPLTIVEVSNVNKKHRLPFKSFSPLDVVITDNVPETKRILIDPTVDPDKVTSLYRNLGSLGSHHRDQSYPLLPLIPWDVHQIDRKDHVLNNWQKLVDALKNYVPPLPSILSRPPLRVMEGLYDPRDVLHYDWKIIGFSSTFPAEGPYSIGLVDFMKMKRDAINGQPYHFMGKSEKLLVSRDYWKKTCTKLVTVTNSDELPNFEKVTPLKLNYDSGITLDSKIINYPKKDDILGKDSHYRFTDFSSPDGNKNIFIIPGVSKNTIGTEVEDTSVVSTIDGKNIVLSPSSYHLFGINSYGVKLEYYSYATHKSLTANELRKGPSLFIGADFLEPSTISLCQTSEELPDVFPQIVDSVEQTSWYKQPFEKIYNPETLYIDITKNERRIRDETVWIGQIENQQLFNLIKSGLIPDPKTITSTSISLLQSDKLVLNPGFSEQSLVLEKKYTPYGVIFVPPSLPLSEAKTANSMKFSSSINKMDMSFTLTQTNTHKLESRTSTDQLCQVGLVEFIDILSTSKDFLPFDMESLAHIFSSLIQVGALELKK